MRKLLITAVTALPLVGLYSPVQARDGGAIAAGIIGGLALGGLAAAAAQPRYYPYPVYGYRPVTYDRDCWFTRRRAHDDFGNVYYRRVRVCD